MIQIVSCVRFVPADEDVKGYIFVNVSESSCWSQVGYIGKEQIVNLGNDSIGYGCSTLGIIQHELLHSLGFVHQHKNSSRFN